MNLIEAQNLLGANSRYFSEVYKLFSFRDEQTLKEYIDFIQHEPVEWLKGFPAKLLTKASFAKPKIAIIQLLKMPEIIAVLGNDYATRAHKTIWQTYKTHANEILLKRNSVPSAPIVDEIIEHTSIHTEYLNEVPMEIEQPSKWEAKYNVLVSVVESLIMEYRQVAPGLANAASLLLAALANA